MLGIKDAEHEESAPGASTLFISRLACSLVGKTQEIELASGSIAHRAYGEQKATEQFFCNYGLNQVFRDEIDNVNLNITGVDPEGEVRIVELADHPFFVATLFLPQVASKPENPHPLILAYLQAAADSRTRKTS